MIIYIANGNPVIATVFMSLITFGSRHLRGPFRSSKLSFSSEEAASNFFEEARTLGGLDSKLESINVVVVPDHGSSHNAAKVIYRAVDAYKDSLISVNEFDILPSTFFDENSNLLEESEQYLKRYFDSDAVSIATPAKEQS